MSTFGAFSVVRSTVKRVLNSSGVLAEVAINTPAFEFNADGTYRGLLVEPAATNLALRSAAFNTTWGKSDITVTDNSIASPDGTTTADTITEGTAGTAEIFQTCTIASGSTATFSIHIKANANNDFVRLIISQSGGFGNRVQTWFNLTNNTFGNSANVGTATGVTVASQLLPNGWYRISLSGAIPSVTSYVISVSSAASSGSSTRVNNASYYLWGAQLETGSVATSYIPTVASTANRTADSVTLTGASSLIGQTEGTLYAEIVARNFNSATTIRRLLTISDGTTSNRIGIASALSQDYRLQGVVVTGGSTVAQIIQTSNNTQDAVIKSAIGYKLDDVAFYVNGSSIGTDTSATIPTCNRIDIGNQLGGEQFLNGWIRSVALFPTRLSNAQLQALTT